MGQMGEGKKNERCETIYLNFFCELKALKQNVKKKNGYFDVDGNRNKF